MHRYFNLFFSGTTTERVLLFLTVLLITSCSVQKRRYRDGFTFTPVSHKHNNSPAVSKSKAVVVSGTDKIQELKTAEPEPVLEAGASKSIALAPEKIRTVLPNDSCDVLVFKDGSEIMAKVLEVGSNEITYKRCESPDGPTYMSKKSELFMLKYRNGTREVFKTTESTNYQKPNNQVPSRGNNKQQRNPSNMPSGGNDNMGGHYKRVVDTNAWFSLILGVISFISSFPTPLIFIAISILAAILAIVYSYASSKKINAEPELYKGKGLAITGRIIGFIMLSLWILAIILVLLM